MILFKLLYNWLIAYNLLLQVNNNNIIFIIILKFIYIVGIDWFNVIGIVLSLVLNSITKSDNKYYKMSSVIEADTPSLLRESLFV